MIFAKGEMTKYLVAGKGKPHHGGSQKNPSAPILSFLKYLMLSYQKLIFYSSPDGVFYEIWTARFRPAQFRLLVPIGYEVHPKLQYTYRKVDPCYKSILQTCYKSSGAPCTNNQEKPANLYKSHSAKTGLEKVAFCQSWLDSKLSQHAS